MRVDYTGRSVNFCLYLIYFLILRNLQFKKYFLTKRQINQLPEFMKFSYNFIFAHHFFVHLKVNARKKMHKMILKILTKK